MKEKEEDEERNENICPQTSNQVNKQRIQTLRSTLILCGSSGERANYYIVRSITLIFLKGAGTFEWPSQTTEDVCAVSTILIQIK